MLTHFKLIPRHKQLKKNLLDKSQLPLIKITHRKLIIWYISNIRNHNFNIFSMKLIIIKVKLNEFILSTISDNFTGQSLLTYQKYTLNTNNWVNLLLKALGKQGLWWKNICLPVSILNNSFNRFNNSYGYIHRVLYNLLYTIKMKKAQKFEQWRLFPELTTSYYANIITKLIFSAVIKNKKMGNGFNLLKQYYKNLIQFKLTELKIINNYNLNNIVNKTNYHINKQIYWKIKKFKKKTLNTKIIKKNNNYKIFNNKLRLIEEKILLIRELIKTYNNMIVNSKRLKYINKGLKKLLNKQTSYFSKMYYINILLRVKEIFNNKNNTANLNLILLKLNRLIMINRGNLPIIIKLFRRNKKFKIIFKYFINKTKHQLLDKLRHTNKIIRLINIALLSKGITTAADNKKKRLFDNYKILKLTKNCRDAIISKLIDKYKKSTIVNRKKFSKIDILTYIYKRLWIISKKKWVLINKLQNKYKKNKILNNKLNSINNKKKNTQNKTKKALNTKWKHLTIILRKNLKKKLIKLTAIDMNKIFRIIRRFPRYSYRIYSANKRPKNFTLQIKRSKLFYIWNYKNFSTKHHLRHKNKQHLTRKKKIDMISWKNRKHFSKKKFIRNLTNLLHQSKSISKMKSLKKKWHINFFLTSLGSTFITNSFHNKYIAAFVAKAATTTLFKNNSDEFDTMWISYQISNYALGYLYFKNINNIQTAVWNYWSLYFQQKSVGSTYSRQLFYIVNDRKRFSPLKGYRNRMKLVCWKKGQTWINKLLLKRRLYSIRHWSIWKRRFPRKRLYKIYRNHKLPDKFYNNRFYINLWYTNYNIRSCRRVLYKWRYRRNLVLKSLRFFYGQLKSQSIEKLLILVNRRVSIYNNKYDRFFCKLDNKLTCQAYNFGLAQNSFWSNQFAKNGWLTISNPDKDIMFLNYLFKIKKSIFPINLFDPKNIYWTKREKSYKFEQYKYLMMPQRKHNFLLTAGDLINFIYSSETFSTKFNDGNTFRMNLPINKNILNGETYEYSVDNKFKVPTLIQREIYNTAVLLFNPRIQDLSIYNRINVEKILFSIRDVK